MQLNSKSPNPVTVILVSTGGLGTSWDNVG